MLCVWQRIAAIRRRMSPEDSSTGPPADSHQLTRLFDGRVVGTDTLFSILNEDLRRMAIAVFAGERKDQTLQPTVLVNEAYLRLADQRAEWQNREHFFAVAARSMRRVLVDQARGRQREKRGGDRQRVTLVDQASNKTLAELDMLEVEDALQQLGKVSERLVQIAELRLFAGLGLDATARVLGVARSTAASDWARARTLLSAYAGDP